MNSKVYAFIDSQNLNLGISSQGWRLDFLRFRIYLKDKYKVEKAFLFIGYLPSKKNLYKYLKDCGYVLIFKPTRINGKNKIVKGNVDAELVLWSANIEYKNYEKAIIVSGDGDFYCLINLLDKKNKLLQVLVPNKKYSGLLRKFRKYLVCVCDLRKKLETKKKERE